MGIKKRGGSEIKYSFSVEDIHNSSRLTRLIYLSQLCPVTIKIQILHNTGLLLVHLHNLKNAI